MFYGCYDEYTIEYINPIGKKPIVIRILDCEKPPLKNFKNVLTIYASDLDRELGIGNVYNESHAKKLMNLY